MQYEASTLPHRLAIKISTTVMPPHWTWVAGFNANGYGCYWRDGGMVEAYKVVWEAFNGTVPSGYELHHHCERTWCVNPEHIRLVTRRQHTALSPNNPCGINARKTHCDHGHPLPTVRNKRGQRVCQPCARERTRRYLARKRAA